MVPDSEIITKGASPPPLPGEVQQSSDPAIQRLALQMQKAGDALYNQYELRVEVSYYMYNFIRMPSFVYLVKTLRMIYFGPPE